MLVPASALRVKLVNMTLSFLSFSPVFRPQKDTVTGIAEAEDIRDSVGVIRAVD